MSGSFTKWLPLVIISPLVACQTSPPKTTEPAEVHAFADSHSAAAHFIRPIFSVLDCEHIGKISSGEVDEHFNSIFFYVDRDQSRSISQEELIRSVYNSTPDKEIYLFKLMDSNGDNEVSAIEFRNFTISTIDSADLDQDGLVSEQEVGLSPVNQ